MHRLIQRQSRFCRPAFGWSQLVRPPETPRLPTLGPGLTQPLRLPSFMRLSATEWRDQAARGHSARVHGSRESPSPPVAVALLDETGSGTPGQAAGWGVVGGVL